MTSRLDRLFVLLEAGGGGATRRAAARQLGEIQKARPEELHRLLGRLMKHLRSPAWDTRVAASQAVEAILSNVPEWHPSPLASVKDEKVEEDTSRLRCETFDIERVLQHGAHLMGSEGTEYDLDEDTLPGAENLAKQRQQLNARLGLDAASQLGVDLTSVYSNEDLCPAKVTPVKTETPRRPVQELMTLTASKPLSSREMNLAKRKARQALCKQKSRDCSEEPSTPPAEPVTKKIKLEPAEEVLVESTGPVPDSSGTWGESARWPLEGWCGALQAQLFGAAWEARHGAASALRELLRARVSTTAGYQAGFTAEQNEDAHQEWLEDMALRLLCVLALDRFGDFVSDQVVAPVRETCAQTLGVALLGLRARRVRLVAGCLRALAAQPQWEARHGALLAFKYLLAARPELGVSCGALEHLVQGLEDGAEDVSAAAAGALVPAARALAQGGGAARVAARLWRLLRDQDDLAAPAIAYMALLAALMALPEAATLIHPIDLSDVLPRLWPYLDHSTSSVRKATLQTLRALTTPLAAHHPHSETNGHGHTETPDQANCDVTSEANCSNSESASDNNVAGVISDKSNVSNTVECNKSDDKEENSSEVNGYLDWTPELLQEAMRHVYQRVLFEHVDEIQDIALEVWEQLVRHAALPTVLVAACPLLATWLCLAMQPARLPVDPALLAHPPPRVQERRGRGGSGGEAGAGAGEARPAQRWLLGGGEAAPAHERDASVMRARTKAAHALGYLSCFLVQPAPGIEYKAEDESPIDCYVKVMVVYLRSGSALQRLVAALVLAAWARHSRHSRHSRPHKEAETDVSVMAPPLLTNTIQTSLNQALYYDEVALTCNRLLQDARDLHALMKHYKLPLDGEQFNNIVRLEQVMQLAETSRPLVAAMKTKRVAHTLEQRRSALHALVTACCQDQGALNVAVQAALASACTWLRALPATLNPVVRPLMESVKKECCEELQALSASALAVLLDQLADRQPCPNNKVLVNLKAFLRCDPEHTPRIALENTEENGESASDSGNEGNSNAKVNQGPALDKMNGILTLWEQQRAAERGTPRRGRPPAHAHHAAHQPPLHEDESRKLLRIQRRGATVALTSLAKYFGEQLPGRLPKLWEFITAPCAAVLTDDELEKLSEEESEELISRLQVLEVVCPSIDGGVWALVAAGAGALGALTRAPYTALRHMAARALAALARRDPHRVMHTIIDQLVPALSDVRNERTRCGAAETLARAVDALQLQIVPYIVLLVVPLMGRMSDQCSAVRVMSTRCFAALIQLMPLDGAAPEPAGLAPELRARRARDKHFLDQLFNPKSIKDYKIPVPVSAELRSYQQAGVNWLRFLYEFKLHGVLCDDMGLGKTLQSLVAVAGSHWERAHDRALPLPSLVVCPPTLTGHWLFEVNKFIPAKFLKPLQYAGPPVERERLRGIVKYYNLIVASYDIVRKDIEFFSKIRWNYCVLDEGHVIKNSRSKAFKAIKQLIANHRLILSGTPIQNNVLELWSLFDFLMPGLLGTERQFTARYSRPILAARDPRAAPHQLQAGALACEALHRQVLPFLLRRVKEDVLQELPPKITQDYYCELSPLQRRLYEHSARAVAPAPASAGPQPAPTARTHVFQALHYLQSVCNHPKLVLTGEHPEAAAIRDELRARNSTLDDIEHAAKLPALKQLLLDCGIGASNSDSQSESVVSQHRALIFCQLKKMLDIVERDLLQRHLPAVTYLRLDGGVPPAQRHAIVTRFNSDVSIDCLLLTTQVGGLGLNLTGADTVIFVEHDWNPMKDLQAMDRAHRIGQKKVVNVYRLVTRDTLEQKIMGLQKFKLMTANTVISSENAAMETMGTEQLLDLFQLSQPGPAGGAGAAAGAGAGALSELWDHSQYEEEYDMTSYIRGLGHISHRQTLP